MRLPSQPGGHGPARSFVRRTGLTGARVRATNTPTRRSLSAHCGSERRRGSRHAFELCGSREREPCIHENTLLPSRRSRRRPRGRRNEPRRWRVPRADGHPGGGPALLSTRYFCNVSLDELAATARYHSKRSRCGPPAMRARRPQSTGARTSRERVRSHVGPLLSPHSGCRCPLSLVRGQPPAKGGPIRQQVRAHTERRSSPAGVRRSGA